MQCLQQEGDPRTVRRKPQIINHKINIKSCNSTREYGLGQLVDALRYNPEGRRFYSRWVHWDFSLTLSFRPHYGPGVDSASKRVVLMISPGSKGGQCVGLTTLPPACADFLLILGASNSWIPTGLFRPVMEQLCTSIRRVAEF
jgi:hypothetical protein